MLFNSTSVKQYNPYVFERQKAFFRNFAISALLLACALVLVPVQAEAAPGLTKAASGLERFFEEIKPLVRWGAIIGIVFAAVGYMFSFVDKSMFIKIAMGIIIIASAREIVDFFWVGTA